jgi:hypothetical protein
MTLQASRVLRQFLYAMRFDGVDDYVRTQTNINLTLPFTVEVWFYTLAPRTSYPTIIANGGLGTPSYGFKLLHGGRAVLVIEHGDGTTGERLDVLNVQLNVWNHIVAVWEGVGKMMKAYLNGRLAGSRSMNVDSSKTYPIYLANAVGNIQSYYNGLIAEARVYSRDLTSDEVQHNANYPDDPVRNGLILWLQADSAHVKDIDNDGVLEWIDLSGFNNHGKIYGAQLAQLIKSPSRVLQAQRVLACAR